jgi:RimJ/RimL family protein N-acetyltransferase
MAAKDYLANRAERCRRWSKAVIKPPTKLVGYLLLRVLDGGSIPPISTADEGSPFRRAFLVSVEQERARMPPRDIVIRQIAPDDAPAFLALCRRLDTETRFMMLEPDERTTTVDEQRAAINGLLASANQMIFVAVDEPRIVGYVEAKRGEFRRNRHSAYIVAGVLQSHAGRGLGSKLFVAVESWARFAGIARLELTVMAHNAAAIRLYEKLGFTREGTRRWSMRVDGEYVDEFAMAKLLD